MTNAARLLQDTAAAMQDTAAALQDTATAFTDTTVTQAHGVGFQETVVESPLPGGVSAVVRFFMTEVPRWVQIGGAILAAIVALLVVAWLWKRRDRIIGWFRTRSRGVRMGLAAAAILLVAVAVGAGTVSWNYIQHDNGFCVSCHVMGPSYEAFTTSEHAELECHDCHRQSIFASMRQLVSWVAERPQDIGTHAHIPDAICQECHATGESEKWTYVEATAGHRTHLESEDPDLADVQCLTCHAPAVHEFVPVDETCAGSGCHDQMDIELGGMANQTSLHCATCHEFTAEVAALATADSVAEVLTPAFDQCTGCHEMRDMLEGFEPAEEPHDARCGVCHNPHEQQLAEDAADTCAGCHDDWQTEPFHVGDAHEDVGEQCTLCHEPHAARVDASDCAGCHRRIAADSEAPPAMRQRLRRAQPFDTAAVLQETRGPRPAQAPGEAHVPDVRASTANAHRPSFETLTRLGGGDIRSLGTLASAGDPAADVALLLGHPPTATPADTFEHATHDELTCLTCHQTAEGPGLNFERPRGCQICHHRAPARSVCADCHDSAEDLPHVSADVTVRPVPDAEPVHRTGQFAHATHAELACVDCHQSPVTLAPPAAVASCASCHEEHHAADITCAGCHAADRDAEDPHAPPSDGHAGCAECHTPETIAELQPDRKFCLTCHQDSVDHEPDGQCTTCHLLATPGEYKARLIGGDPAAS